MIISTRFGNIQFSPRPLFLLDKQGEYSFEINFLARLSDRQRKFYESWLNSEQYSRGVKFSKWARHIQDLNSLHRDIVKISITQQDIDTINIALNECNNEFKFRITCKPQRFIDGLSSKHFITCQSPKKDFKLESKYLFLNPYFFMIYGTDFAGHVTWRCFARESKRLIVIYQIQSGNVRVPIAKLTKKIEEIFQKKIRFKNNYDYKAKY